MKGNLETNGIGPVERRQTSLGCPTKKVAKHQVPPVISRFVRQISLRPVSIVGIINKPEVACHLLMVKGLGDGTENGTSILARWLIVNQDIVLVTLQVGLHILEHQRSVIKTRRQDEGRTGGV